MTFSDEQAAERQAFWRTKILTGARDAGDAAAFTVADEIVDLERRIDQLAHAAQLNVHACEEIEQRGIGTDVVDLFEKFDEALDILEEAVRHGDYGFEGNTDVEALLTLRRKPPAV